MKLLKVLIVILLLAGVAVIAYPHISKMFFDMKSAGQIESFECGEEYLELRSAFESYNKALVDSGQSELTGSDAYSTFPVNSAQYGVEDDMMGYIEVPSQKIKMPIYLGASEDNIKRGAGVMGYTSAPIGGQSTNCVIASHNVWNGALRFKNINQLNPGDVVYLTNLWEKLTYRVVEREIIEPDDVEAVYIREGEDLITLMTCDNYGPDGPDRCVVYCSRVQE